MSELGGSMAPHAVNILLAIATADTRVQGVTATIRKPLADLGLVSFLG